MRDWKWWIDVEPEENDEPKKNEGETGSVENREPSPPLYDHLFSGFAGIGSRLRELFRPPVEETGPVSTKLVAAIHHQPAFVQPPDNDMISLLKPPPKIPGTGLVPPFRSRASMPLEPVGRLPLLDAEIKNLKEKLGATRKRIQYLELKKAKYGIDFSASDAIELEERIEDAKKFALETKVLEKERELQKQYETELVAVAPIHMVLAIAQKGRPTYIDTLAMCEKIMRPLFDDHSLLLGYSKGILARQFKDRAALESKKSGQQISAKELIEREIKELEDLAPYHKDALLLGHCLDSLRKAEGALESDQQPISFSPVLADTIAQALPQLPGSDGGHGICFQLDEKRRLKITVLHQPLVLQPHLCYWRF